MENATQKLLTLPDLSSALDLPADWLRAEALSGRIPCVQAGTRLIFSFDAVVRVLLDRAATARFEETKP